MRIAVASGKGGTGKTLIATNLASILAVDGRGVQYVDCDVEEPNGHIFLKPRITRTERVTVSVPEVAKDKCTGCGKCGDACRYSAIVCIKGTTLTFEQLCHSCGACGLVCPADAITEKKKAIGTIEAGSSQNLSFAQGRLDIGDVRSPALIRAVKKQMLSNGTAIIDSPPGTSCAVVETLEEADFVLLVTEPTPFGLHDLQLAVEMVRIMGLSFAVVINRYDIGDDRVARFCAEDSIETIRGLPNDRQIAQAYANGRLVTQTLPEYEKFFTDIIDLLRRQQ